MNPCLMPRRRMPQTTPARRLLSSGRICLAAARFARRVLKSYCVFHPGTRGKRSV